MVGGQPHQGEPVLVELGALTGETRPLATERGGSAVELRGLTKTYGAEPVVDAIDAAIRPGEFFSLLGPSGSGKTTTLMMIAGFVTADAGALLVDGRDVAAVPPQRRGFGMVFQNYAIFPHMNVFENIAFPLRARGVRRQELGERVAWALDLVRLAGYGERLPRQLSGGQQQRVAIARAIVFHPKVVLMDEPLGALDKNLRYEMQVEIKEIQQRLNMTVIYVTHDQEEAMNLSDRIAILNRGRIEQQGEPRAVYERPINRFVGQFLGEANLLEGRIESIGDGEATLRMGDGATFRARTQLRTAPQAPATLFVRPEKLSIATDGSASPAGDPATNRATGRVRRAAFLGSRLRCAVQLGEGTVVAIDVPNAGALRVPVAGETVSLAWPVADSLILPA
ncbi:MAG: ABC transporter ATP-binding protein [Alphaproteobacteria bacterium]|nr:ABC transporter ATP-binding protein [Alphaproteobacteria bacterium]